MDDERTRFVVFLLADPHLLECGEQCEDGSTDPDGVFTLGWCDDLDFHRGWCECGDILPHAVGEAFKHCRTSGVDCVGVEVLSDVDVALHDAVVRRLVNVARFHSEKRWLNNGSARCRW